MNISHRQDHIYLLCILFTGLMVITSVFNVMYIVRRSFLNNINENIQTSTSVIRQAGASVKSVRLLEKTSGQFEETYQTFLQSFIQNYLPVTENRSVSLNYCPPVPPNLRGPLAIKPLPKNFSILTNSSHHADVQFGGHYEPKSCLARHRVAIIVPYRNRWDILEYFLHHTHQILKRQQLDYRIYVCEQAYDNTFNKGIVMNGCFKEILKLQPDTPCFIMHDVDLLLIDDRNMYTCPIAPRHLSVAIDKFHFYLPYNELVGGVLGKKNVTNYSSSDSIFLSLQLMCDIVHVSSIMYITVNFSNLFLMFIELSYFYR
jgi:hypothetical protein